MATRKTLAALDDYYAVPADTEKEVKAIITDKIYFGELLSDIGTAAECLDAYTQTRLLVDIGKSILSSIGWNRAFLEQIFYGTAERALGLQGTPKDEAGFFIGFEPNDKPTDINGHVTQSLYDRLSDKQMDLVDDLETKETHLWDVYDAAERAWRTLTGETNTMVKPTARQRKAGLLSLDDIVEDTKRQALEYKVNGSEEEQARKRSEQAKVYDFKRAQRAALREMRSAKIR